MMSWPRSASCEPAVEVVYGLALVGAEAIGCMCPCPQIPWRGRPVDFGCLQCRQ